MRYQLDSGASTGWSPAVNDNLPTRPPARPRIEYDSRLQAEVTLTYDDEGLLVTFGAMEPTRTGSWGVVIYALRSAVIEATGGAGDAA